MKQILEFALKKKIGIAAFNVIGFDQVNSVFCCVEKNLSPVIIQIAEVHFPIIYDLKELISFIRYRALKSNVPVALHLDHGGSIDTVIRAIQLGFTSVMYDASHKELEKNTSETSEVVDICKKLGITVEAELGGIGSEGTSENGVDESLFTNPQQAIEFCAITQIDAIAISFGNVHGKYKNEPKLRFDIIDDIARGTKLPVVFHGGSGVSESDFKKAIGLGIAKINVYTSIENRMLHALNAEYKGHHFANKILHCAECAEDEMKKHLQYFGSIGTCREMW